MREMYCIVMALTILYCYQLQLSLEWGQETHGVVCIPEGPVRDSAGFLSTLSKDPVYARWVVHHLSISRLHEGGSDAQLVSLDILECSAMMRHHQSCLCA